MWWRFVHEAARGQRSPRATAAADPGGRTAAGARDRGAAAGRRPRTDEEDAELAAYNDYLAQLAERDKATGR